MNMKWINAGDIKTWVNANQRHCQETFPELVRRLILAHTVNSVEEFDFPSGDSVATGGWDGRLKTPIISPFFPSGVSGWEIGTEKSAEAKAEKDYEKRSVDPLGMSPNESTFVFVTPRPFPKRAKWQSEKRATGTWKDVKVIAADVLEQWLDITPAVALWLARQIGKVVSVGVRDLEAAWTEWSLGTKPAMTPALAIGGRTSDAAVVQKWIDDPPSIREVQGDHPDEALAFLYASIATLPEVQRAQAFARCVVVENIADFRAVTQAFPNYPLIIAGPGECINAAPAAVAKGHHVFISMDATVVGIRDVLRLARPHRDVVERVLREGGLSEADAQRAARDSGRSIPVLRRYLFQANAVSAPKWANAVSAQILLPVLFANAWDENRDGDRQVVETLLGMGYDACVRDLSLFLSIEDAPVRKVGSIWMIKSPLDTWFLLGPFLTHEQLKLFKQSLLAVLTKTDPKYELEAEKRWAAAMYGKSNPYSEWLRTGLVESLVLVAVYGNRSPGIASTQAFADRVVKEVFATADKWESWASIKDATPLLAEAAPDPFMESVEQGIGRNPGIFQALLSDDPGAFGFGECRHSGLLWALEGIAWGSEYLARAANVLQDLTVIDPPGRWNNRPINSLRDVFLPGFPQTHAKPKERLDVLSALIAKNPKTVWEFAHRYYGNGSISESHRFRWRDTGGQRRGLEREPIEEQREYLTGLLPILQDLACSRDNLIVSMNEFTRLPVETREKLLITLTSIDPATFSKEERDLLLQKTRQALNWINSYGGDDLRAHVPGLDRILDDFAPTDVIERVGWLLSTPWPRLLQGKSDDYSERDATVKAAQKEAAREMLDKASPEKILEFAGTIQYQGVLGHALATAVKDEQEDNAILDGMLLHVTDIPLVIRGYASGRIEVAGREWIDAQIGRMKTRGNYSPEACALLHLGLPEGSDTWLAVATHGKDVETVYWKHASGYSRTSRIDDTAVAVEHLLDAKRPEVALQLAGDPQVDIPSILLRRLLQELLNMDDKKLRDRVMEEYYLGHVFDQLYRKNDLPTEELVKLEWPFAGLFDDLRRYTSSPTAIHRALQTDPQFFAILISFIYRRDDLTPDPTRDDISAEVAEVRARTAHKVLDSWYLLPGLKEDGTLDEKKLADWVEAARRQCGEIKRVTGCDIQIGFMLAHAPADPDGPWPHVAVRNLIERLGNDTIDRHIQNEIYNSRGVVSRAIDAGGEQERALAERYKKLSESAKTNWPRTAAMLRGIAASYEHDAKREDIDAELSNFRWD